MRQQEGAPRVDLGVQNLKELQRRGLENPTDLRYRVDVATQIAVATGTQRMILYDDLAEFDDTSRNAKGLPIYERSLLPGLLMAPGFEKGAATIVAAPPSGTEIRYLQQLKLHLEERLARPVDYEVLIEQDGSLVDLLAGDKENYTLVVDTFAEQVATGDTSHFEPNYHSGVINRHLSRLAEDGDKVFVSPYERKPEHAELFSSAIEEGKIVLPDVPDMDKAHNYFVLKDNGFTHLPEMLVVSSTGKLIETREEFMADEARGVTVEKTDEAVEALAKGVVTAINRLQDEKGMQGYVKIDPNGVSGRGNLDPGHEVFAQIYDRAVPDEVKHQILEETINSMFEETLPARAVVEEYIKADEIEGVPVDYTVRGKMIKGVYFPISVSHIGATNGEYDKQWTAPEADDIGESNQEWRILHEIFAEMGEITARELDYEDGEFGGDVFKRTDGTYAVHDYNHRRGGASASEAVLPLVPEESEGGVFKAIVKTELPVTDPSDPVARAIAYDLACDALFADGFMPYSTGVTMHDQHEGPETATFTVLMPVSLGGELTRNQHFAYAQERVAAAVERVLVS